MRFSKDQMLEVLDNHEKWWNGTLNRPLVKATIYRDYEKKTPAPILTQKTCTELNWTPEQVVDALDESFNGQEYLGDAFPFVNLDAFGPGVVSAFCGARLDNSAGSVWFFPQEEKEIADIHVRYDPDSLWAKRVKAICKAAVEKWQGTAVMGFADLGGVMDVAATFRGTENLLCDLIEEPEEVERLVSEIEVAWRAAYDDIKAILEPQGMFSHWSGLLSKKASYIVQCDFSYMISPAMFNRFVLPTLRRDTENLDHVIYHLDGIGEIPHLDSLLTLPDLDAVQWVYGAGHEGAAQWMPLYKKILASGKRLMPSGSAEEFLQVIGETHAPAYGCFGFGEDGMELAKKLIAAR